MIRRRIILLALTGIFAVVAGGVFFYTNRPHLADQIVAEEIGYIQYHYNPYNEQFYTLVSGWPESERQVAEIVNAVNEFRSLGHDEYTGSPNLPVPDYEIMIGPSGADYDLWWIVAIYQEDQVVKLSRGQESLWVSADPTELYDVIDRIFLEAHPNAAVTQ